MSDKHRFAHADLAGDDHEALTLFQAKLQLGQRLAMRLAFEIEGRIGRELERLAGKPIEFHEHSHIPFETAIRQAKLKNPKLAYPKKGKHYVGIDRQRSAHPDLGS
jgi:hypothetical protein